MAKLRVEKKDLQHLFDLAVGSLDFGSGFWESDDVDAARRIAEVLGVEPWEAVPRGFEKNYEHEYEVTPPVTHYVKEWVDSSFGRTQRNTTEVDYVEHPSRCRKCGLEPVSKIHKKAVSQ